jgi:hypothetical protein
MSRGLSRKQRDILIALDARPEREQELRSLAHWCHGCIPLDWFKEGADFCKKTITRSEAVSVARAVRSLKRRGLVQTRTRQASSVGSTWRYSSTGKHYEHSTTARYVLVRLSVSHEEKFPRRKHLEHLVAMAPDSERSLAEQFVISHLIFDPAVKTPARVLLGRFRTWQAAHKMGDDAVSWLDIATILERNGCTCVQLQWQGVSVKEG